MDKPKLGNAPDIKRATNDKMNNPLYGTAAISGSLDLSGDVMHNYGDSAAQNVSQDAENNVLSLLSAVPVIQQGDYDHILKKKRSPTRLPERKRC